VREEYRREFGGDPGRMPLQAIVFSAAKPSQNYFAANRNMFLTA
jgi:hypothetical protein